MAAAFDFQPTLTGRHFVVRPLLADDWPALFRAASDPQIWVQHPASDRYTESGFRAYFDGALECGSAFVFVDKATAAIAGSSRYYGYDSAVSEIEIGWTFLARDYWGGSANSEIKALMLEHAFRYVNTVVFWVGESNLRSRRAMEKIGGVLRDGIHYRDASGDAPNVIYEIRKPV